jgi:hypothetical protein
VNKCGIPLHETRKNEVPCHSRCGTIKIYSCSNALSTEHRLNLCSHSSEMVTSPYKWKILEQNVKPWIINQSICKGLYHDFSTKYSFMTSTHRTLSWIIHTALYHNVYTPFDLNSWIFNFFGLSTTEETWLIEMRTWCIKIGIVLVLLFNLWVEGSAGGLLVPEGLYNPVGTYFAQWR